MSDTTPDRGQTVDRRRVLASLAAACAVHAALFIAFALGVGTGSGAAVLPPVTIDLQAPLGEASSAPAGPGSSSAGGAAQKAGIPAPAAPVQAPTPSAGSGSSTSGGFVIPSPRVQAAEPRPPASGGSAFRQAGGKTGVVQGIPSVPGPVTAPGVPPVQQGKGTGAASSSGAGGSQQRSGTAVLVPGASGSTARPAGSRCAGQGAGRRGGKGRRTQLGRRQGRGRIGRRSGRRSRCCRSRWRPGRKWNKRSGGNASTGGGQGYNVVWGSSEAGEGEISRLQRQAGSPRVGEQAGADAFRQGRLHGAAQRGDHRREHRAVVGIRRRRAPSDESNPHVPVQRRSRVPPRPRARSRTSSIHGSAARRHRLDSTPSSLVDTPGGSLYNLKNLWGGDNDLFNW